MSDIRVSAINSIQSIDHWLKVLAGNLTGSNVNGYRQQRVEFSDVLALHVTPGGPATSSGASSIAPVDIPIGGSRIKAIKTDFSQGALQTTGQATDLGIQGDGMFVLSKVRNPTSMSDLVFTRNGSFHFDFVELPGGVPGGGPRAAKGEWRLINQDGLFVMGFRSDEPDAYVRNAVDNLPGVPAPPREQSFSSTTPPIGNGAFGFNPPNQAPRNDGFTFSAITIPFQNDPNPIDPAGKSQNLNVNFKPSFNPQGWVQLDSDAPFVDPNDPTRRLVQFVGLAKFADPTGLQKVSGGTDFAWDQVAGDYYLGVASAGNGPVGSSNTLSPGTLETSNSSVNTTLPELTIAQKSFTANVKIVQVGNNLVDDLNNLIR